MNMQAEMDRMRDHLSKTETEHESESEHWQLEEAKLELEIQQLKAKVKQQPKSKKGKHDSMIKTWYLDPMGRESPVILKQSPSFKGSFK